MTKQPEALRIAGILEMPSRGTFERHTAAELRRLHVRNLELLEALKGSHSALGLILSFHGQGSSDYADVAQGIAENSFDLVDSILRKATGETE